jgi:hypothetical protein
VKYFSALWVQFLGETKCDTVMAYGSNKKCVQNFSQGTSTLGKLDEQIFVL